MFDLSITTIVEEFISQITAAVELAAAQRIQAALAGAFDLPQKRGPGRPAKQAAGVGTVAEKAVTGKKTRTATPKAIRARKLQGQYMGALKSLTGADRAKVKAVAKEKGVAEAVKLALGLKTGR
jgi:hypothetical protein